MKIRLEIDKSLVENEIVIRCSEYTDNIEKLHQSIVKKAHLADKLSFTKGDDEFFFPSDNVLFFETENDSVFAHTHNDAFKVNERLYHLEQVLAHNFIRISKSCIVNIRHIYSISRNLTAASLVEFQNSDKQVYASRHYYKFLRDRLSDC